MGFKKKKDRIKKNKGLIEKAKEKARDELHKYCEKVVLPNSYYVYRRLMNNGQVVEYDEYLQMVYDELKTPQEARS